MERTHQDLIELEECTITVRQKWSGRDGLLYAGIAFSAVGFVGIVVSVFFLWYDMRYLPQIAAFIVASFVLNKVLFFLAAWGDAVHQYKHVESVPPGTMKSIFNKNVSVNVRFTIKVSDEIQESSTSDEHSEVAASN